tara:strand:- start:6047 stop:7249 length:1203 start_codon:yes stop_codon:yes gene_type:complete
MKILILSDDYLPDGTRAHSRMLHDLALEFKGLGEKVTVLTPGNSSQSDLLETSYLDGIEVWRFRSGKLRGVAKARRLINELLIPYNAWKATRSKLKDSSFDLCVNYSPTIFYGPYAKKLKQQGSFVYLVLRDFFPQWAIDQGIISRRSPIAIFLRYFEELNYRTSDCIGLQSPANLNLFKARFPNLKSRVLMNWTSLNEDPENVPSSVLQKKYQLEGKVIFFYGGNIGHAQDMKNLMRLARNMTSHPKAHFLFVGQGDEFELINKIKRNQCLDNVTILNSVSQEAFLDFLAMSDIGLFSLSKKHTAFNFPGKLLGYMKKSLPILGSVNSGNDLRNLIATHKAGMIFENGQDEPLYKASIKLLENETLRRDLGKNSNSLLSKEFSVESAALKILEEYKLSR